VRSMSQSLNCCSSLHANRRLSSSAEFEDLVKACEESTLFQERIASLELPKDFEVVVEPWPYGAPEIEDGDTRLFQALIFARDTSSGNPDSNFYAFPLPLIPVMDARSKKIVRIDDLATGGKGDPLKGKTHKPAVLEHCEAAEYAPELLPGGIRKDLKPLTVVQPEGPSFSITDGNLIKWQKWSMRATFNPREGAVLHDIRFDGRSILYRLSMSDMASSCPFPFSRLIVDSANSSFRRLCRMPTPDLLSTGSKLLISVTEDWVTLSII